MTLHDLQRKALNDQPLTRDEALYLLHYPDKATLYEAAAEITRRMMGDKFDTCSIINAQSGNCSEDCKWCAQSRHYTTGAETYLLLPDREIVELGLRNAAQGIRRYSVVTSGRGSSTRTLRRICSSIRALRNKSKIQCCASMGLLRKEQLQELHDAGIENYHCNLETAPSYFATLCTTHTTAEKLATLMAAREVGMRLCSGGIIGMGESAEQRIELAMVLRDHAICSIPLNVLQPIPGTPLAENPPLTDDEILTTVALFRFINPNAYLRFAGGRTLMPEALQRRALQIGINSAIVGDLLTTSGSNSSSDKTLFESEGYRLDVNTDWDEHSTTA